jgi:hypothetical protein
MTRSRDTANILPTVDAKGDLLVGTGNSTINNLPAGGDGSYLRANSVSATGLEWGTIEEPDYTSDQAILASQIFG